jgi:hypothetical protein
MLRNLIFCFLISFNVFAFDDSLSVARPVAVGSYDVGVGSLVRIQSQDQRINGDAIFLGNATRPDGSSSFQMLLNLKSNKVFYVDSANFQSFNTFESQLQRILDPYEQAGGTCTGYAMFHFMAQTNLTGSGSNNELAREMSTEDSRSKLLVDTIQQYYMMAQHRYSINGILNGFGKRFGFSCKKLNTANYAEAKTKILAQLGAGLPVLVSFTLGPNMVQGPFNIEFTDVKNGVVDNRLWIPRKIGERNAGGHSIVAAASFVKNNRTYLVMIDSDWSEPRIWDMDSFLNTKTALDEVDFVFCK